MKTRVIVIHEGIEWLYIDDSEERHLNHLQYKQLQNYLLRMFGHLEMLLIRPNRLMFINYVGFIKLESVYLEILPKVSVANDLANDRIRLVQMLIRSGSLPVKLDYNSQEIFKSKTILDIFSDIYITELSYQLNKGVFKEYIRVNENINTLKGKLLLNEQIRRNCFNKTKAFCAFDEFTENNPINRILKLALRVLAINNFTSKRNVEINKLFGSFSEVEDITLNEDLLNAVTINRQNERFVKVFQIAKLILLKLYSKNTVGKEDSFSMLFEMNLLYEKYVAYLATKISAQSSIKIKKQDSEKYLLVNAQSNRKTINLKPDIVLEKDEKMLILDTKWKVVVKANQPSYSISDIYQMYAYVTRYENAMECILLYPRTVNNAQLPKWNLHNPYDQRAIRLADIRLDTEFNSINDLKDLVLNSFI